MAEVATRRREIAAQGTVVPLDHTDGDGTDGRPPLSHAAPVRAYVEIAWPSRGARR